MSIMLEKKLYKKAPKAKSQYRTIYIKKEFNYLHIPK